MSSFDNTLFIVSLVLTTILVINSCQAEDDQSKMQRFFNSIPKADVTKCLEEAGLTEEELKELREKKPMEPNTKRMCFLKCLATVSGMIDKNGMIVGDLVKKTFPSLDEAAIKCMEAVGKVNTCEDMAKVKQCMHKP